jgi:hypothetical protein
MSSSSVAPFCLARAEMEDELLGVAAGGEGRDGNEAAVLRRQFRAFPGLSEQDVVGVADEDRGEITEHLLGAGRFAVGCVVCHRCCPSCRHVAVRRGVSRRVAAAASGATIGPT